ncbi:lipopolysaccharide export system ATP-binding protein [Paucidesulfovibrio gracilis DSM 16080]|uniref:Lipopolysaccharide export system ATP-binding protein LptB n=1 Tax=Paucidesulfovibrio gracilis DSM 16080 TaxID=1121449 RepID=A0A1T4WMA3_9BACT|nr:LPS export ABC transporter ATP-binding protein [Paucidesulfovibrio gracilis]SKA78349.1 lipopolysaccharide export system ATP-binding protein [Paucidesulfovibrio gracilis DSM 16080]
MPDQLSATGLSKRYGKREVVHGVDVALTRKEVVGLLGPNGAGKTTTFYMLAGIIKPNSGSVSLGSRAITRLPLHERARMGLSYLPQESSVFRKLTVLENLMIILEQTSLKRAQRRKRAAELLRMFNITKLAHQKAMFLSGGERRRLEIARALIMNPKFILLDEPFAGIDPIAVIDIQEIISILKKMGIGILISDHNVRETLNICDRAYLVYEGTIILEGTPDEIVQDSKARKVYLGENFCL